MALAEGNGKDFAVGYSGGLDSTVVSLLLGQYYAPGRVHLLTIRHGYGQILPCLSKIHVRDLRHILGAERVEHHYVFTKRTFQQMVMSDWYRQLQRYGWGNSVVCMGCTLAMDVHFISYCLEHMVPMFFWGYTPVCSDYVAMSLPEACYERRKVFAEFGLLLRMPLIEWHMEKEEERSILRSSGIWPGFRFRKIAMGVQPPCCVGIFMHHMDIFFDIHPQPDRLAVSRFVRDRVPLLRRLVRERLEAKGIDVEARIALLRQLNDDEWERYGPEGKLLDPHLERKKLADAIARPSLLDAQAFAHSVPLFNHATLSRDGRPLR